MLTYIAVDISPCVCVSVQGSFYVPSENCLQRAHTWHRRLCRLLLVAHRGLHTYYTALMKEVPQLQQTARDVGEDTRSYFLMYSNICLYHLLLGENLVSSKLFRD